jgi:hypothetical protein
VVLGADGASRGRLAGQERAILDAFLTHPTARIDIRLED